MGRANNGRVAHDRAGTSRPARHKEVPNFWQLHELSISLRVMIHEITCQGRLIR